MRDCGCHSHNGLLLSPEGLAQRSPESLELAGVVTRRYLDKVGSVSGLELERDLFVHDDEYLDQQYRRFQSGS